jgi:hypothetical protein
MSKGSQLEQIPAAMNHGSRDIGAHILTWQTIYLEHESAGGVWPVDHLAYADDLLQAAMNNDRIVSIGCLDLHLDSVASGARA